MHTLPLADIDTLFLDAGNTLVGMDLALVCERLAAHGIAAEPADVERAEAGARPELSRLLARGRSSEDRDTFVFHIRNAIAALPSVAARADGGDAADAELDRIAYAVAHELKDAGTRRLWSRVLPGVPAALHAAGVRLAVVSNFDGTIRRSVVDWLVEQQNSGAVPTGLLFLDPSANPEMHEASQTPETPLTEVSFASLCPGSSALEALQRGYR